MLLQTCVRCSKGFEQWNNHPLAHFSTICETCKKQSQETIYDQQQYNFKSYFKYQSENK